jgi:hypothetical protein
MPALARRRPLRADLRLAQLQRRRHHRDGGVTTWRRHVLDVCIRLHLRIMAQVGVVLHERSEQAVLLKQVFVIDGKATVTDILKKAEKDLGAPVKVAGFVRYALGEGIEKKEDDFAAEVAAAVGASN